MYYDGSAQLLIGNALLFGSACTIALVIFLPSNPIKLLLCDGENK